MSEEAIIKELMDNGACEICNGDYKIMDNILYCFKENISFHKKCFDLVYNDKSYICPSCLTPLYRLFIPFNSKEKDSK